MKLYIVNTDEISPELKQRYTTLLSPGDLARSHVINNIGHRQQFITGRALIRDICGCDPSISPSGKPSVKTGYISLAHSGPFVVLITADTPVGVDIEDTAVHRDFEALSRRLGFSKKVDTAVDFYLSFTAYEADFKAGMPKLAHFCTYINTFIIMISTLNKNEKIESYSVIPFVRHSVLSLPFNRWQP